MMRYPWALSIFLLLLFSVSCSRKRQAISPERRDITESVYASGMVKSQHQYEVFTTASGIVKKVLVQEGSRVEKGSALFEIANSSSKLSSDNAQLVASINDYKQNRDKLRDAQKAIDLAQKKMSQEAALLARQQALWAQGIGAKIELEQRELSFENAKVAWQTSQLAYDDLQRQLRFASEQSKNNLRIAQSLEEDLVVKSTLNGLVYKVNVKAGELATAQQTLAVVGEEDFVIEMNVDELDIIKIREGQKVVVRMDSYRSQVFEAKISAIYPMMNERTRSFRVEAVFVDPPERLYPNLSLEASIVVNEKKGILTIPTNYIQNGSVVMLADERLRKVEIGLQDYELTEIVSGLAEDDQILMPEK